MYFFHVSHINIHLYWSMEKFHKVWNQEVTWNDKSYLCWNCTVKWMETLVIKRTLQPCPMTLEELYNRSYERFMSSRYQENAPIGLKLLFKLYRDASLTCVDQSLRLLAWQWNLNKSWSLSGVEQTLFLDQEPDQLGTKSNWGSNFESTAVFRVWKIG